MASSHGPGPAISHVVRIGDHARENQNSHCSVRSGLTESGDDQARNDHGNGTVDSFTPLNREPSYWSISDMTFTPHVEEQSKAVLSWKHLTVRSKRSPEKALLKDLSGNITGGFWSLMGPSGSGKSTLVNTLACRLTPGMWFEGEIRLNGRMYCLHDLKCMSGYVMQDDLMNGALTVWETLFYAGELRLPHDMTVEHRRERVEESIVEMGIGHVRDVVVGDSLHKGISGGERKRLAVAMELITHPVLLFLDEPTSGLDSVTALSLCSKLKSLAASGRTTVICTIHQPQSKLFALFDNLILLKAGEIVYLGPAGKAVSFFEKAGFPCPPMTNPADHLMDVITPELGEDADIARAKGDRLKKYFTPKVVDLHAGSDRPAMPMRQLIPWPKQFHVLFRRSLQEHRRKWVQVATQILNSILMSILIGFVFYRIGDSQASISVRQAVLFFCVINQGIFASLETINSFPSERALTLRERAAGTYNVSAYFLAKTATDTLFQLLPPVVFSAIVYHLVGLQDTPEKFWVFTGFMILCQLSATSLATMVSCVARTTDLSVVVLPLFIEIGRLFGGYFLPPAQLPLYFSWLYALSYVKYTYVGIAQNELSGLKFTCLPSELVDAACPISSGEEVIKRLGLDFITRDQAAGILILLVVICRVVAYLGLRFIKW